MGESISIFYTCICVSACIVGWMYAWCVMRGWCAWCVMRGWCVLQLKLKMRCVKDEGYKINTITIYNV